MTTHQHPATGPRTPWWLIGQEAAIAYLTAGDEESGYDAAGRVIKRHFDLLLAATPDELTATEIMVDEDACVIRGDGKWICRRCGIYPDGQEEKPGRDDFGRCEEIVYRPAFLIRVRARHAWVRRGGWLARLLRIEKKIEPAQGQPDFEIKCPLFESPDERPRGRMCSSVACRTVNLYRHAIDPVSDLDTCVRCGAPLDPFDPPLQ